jgi:hypothetical protein
MTPPSWLPAIVSCDGVWDDVLAVLYGIFDRDFRQRAPRFRSLPVWWDRTVKPGERYEEGFWHLITRDDHALGERLADFRRAERLPWCRPTLDNEQDPAVAVWDYDKGRKQIRTYVWLRDFDYVVVLERRIFGKRDRPRSAMFLVTAYHVDGDRTRRQLEASFAARVP